jgi:ubiquinone/menaquinone biosynthesis C-methylase UbiE
MKPVRDELNRHYDAFYARDAEHEWRDLGARQKAESVRALAADMDVHSVLDAGCGEGSVLALLLPAFPDAGFVGIDVAESAIEAARSRDLGVELALFDGAHIDAADDSYDLAILSHVIEHVADPRGLILETARVARNVVIEVPLELHLRTPPYRWDDTGHINVYNRRSIRHLIESCGLIVDRERVYCPDRAALEYHGGRRGTVKWAIKNALIRLGGESVFTYHYAVLAH